MADWTPDKIRTLVAKCDKPDAEPADVAELHKMLDELPTLGMALTTAYTSAEDALLNYMAARRVFTVEALRIQQKQLRNDLGYATAPMLERILIDTIALAWLGYLDAERRCANVLSEGASIEVARYWDSRVSAAQRRYLRACETLARVRRLAVPVMQVNIGEKQVNQVNVAAEKH